MARNKYPEETKNKIIDTAAKLFIENGYEHTSIQDIIDHLGGLSKGAIYHHFKSKEEIMWAVADRMYEGSEYTLEKVARRMDLNGAEKLKEIFRTSLNSTGQTDIFSAAPDMLKNPQLLVRYLEECVQKDAPDVLRPILEEGIADGSIQTAYPKELAEVLLLIGNFWLNPMIYHCSTEELVSKLKFFQHLTQLFGLDIIDEGMIGQMQKYSKAYEKNRRGE
jgi:AcrR family transcriptional regulator